MLPRFRNFSKKKSGGFTLVELIVVIGITVFMASILISYSHRSGEQIILNTEKAKIAQTILRVKSLALAGFTQPASAPAPCAYVFSIDYSAVTFSISEYSPSYGCDNIFNAQNSIDDIATNPSRFKSISTDQLNPEVKFPSSLPADHLTYLVFVPPEPKAIVFEDSRNMYLNPDPSPKVIYLETLDGSLKTSISVNPSTGQLTF